MLNSHTPNTPPTLQSDKKELFDELQSNAWITRKKVTITIQIESETVRKKDEVWYQTSTVEYYRYYFLGVHFWTKRVVPKIKGYSKTFNLLPE